MKRNVVLAGIALCCLFMIIACGQQYYRAYSCDENDCSASGSSVVIPRCEIRAENLQPLPQAVYTPSCLGNCIAILPAFDQAGWWESNLHSKRLSGRKILRLGCKPDGSGCNTATFNFDFTNVQEDAEIVSAKLAVFIVADPGSMSQSVLKGRMNVGSDYTVVSGPPGFAGKWALYDISDFARQAVLEWRNSVSFELGIPCGVGCTRAAMATLAMGVHRAVVPRHTVGGPYHGAADRHRVSIIMRCGI